MLKNKIIANWNEFKDFNLIEYFNITKLQKLRKRNLHSEGFNFSGGIEYVTFKIKNPCCIFVIFVFPIFPIAQKCAETDTTEGGQRYKVSAVS